jgi:protein associated with RNAse G/E
MLISRFAEGATATRRDVLDGQVFSAAPHRVLHDTGDELLLAHWPGIAARAPRTWTDWLRTGDDGFRKRALPNLAARSWELDDWVWQDTGRLSWFGVDEWFSVHRFFDLAGTPLNWYINFERPLVRTRSGVDTFDVMIDLEAAPDLSSWWWKDEDEYAELCRLGVVGDDEIRQIEAARERAVALVESRGGPLAEDWSSWRADPAWPIPVLPGRPAPSEQYRVQGGRL